MTETIRSGIIDPAAFAGKGDLLAVGMTASLLAAGIWSFAWWQDHQAAEQARDAAAPQVAAVPLDLSEPIVR